MFESTVQLFTRDRRREWNYTDHGMPNISVRRCLFETLGMLVVGSFFMIFLATGKSFHEQHVEHFNIRRQAYVLSQVDLRRARQVEIRPMINKRPSIVWHSVDTPVHSATCKSSYDTEIKCNVYSMKNSNVFLKDVDAHLFRIAKFNVTSLPLPRNGKVWGMFFEETPLYEVSVFHKKFLNMFNFSATYNRRSDVAFPLFSLGSLDELTSSKYYVKTAMKNKFLNKIAPVLYLETECGAIVDANKYVSSLMNYIKIDCYGCLGKNVSFPDYNFKDSVIDRHDRFINDKDSVFWTFMAKYKFVIAVENAYCNDFMSHKLWQALRLGVVPIYFGSPTVMEWLPNDKSAILVEDYDTPEMLATHLIELLQNDTKYEEYLEHKRNKISNLRIINELNLRPYQLDLGGIFSEFECFICKKLYEETNGNIHTVTSRNFYCPSIPVIANLPMRSSWIQLVKSVQSEVDFLYEHVMNNTSIDVFLNELTKH